MTQFMLVRLYCKQPGFVRFANIAIEEVLPLEEALKFADECLRRDEQHHNNFVCHDVLVIEEDGSVVEELYNERDVN